MEFGPGVVPGNVAEAVDVSVAAPNSRLVAPWPGRGAMPTLTLAA
jgi:hypothetical protein